MNQGQGDQQIPQKAQLLLPFPSPILYLPNFVSFSKIHQVRCVLRIYSWISGLALEHSQLSRAAYPLKEN